MKIKEKRENNNNMDNFRQPKFNTYNYDDDVLLDV